MFTPAWNVAAEGISDDMSSSLVGDLTVSDVVLDAAQAHADGAALVTAGRVAT